MSIHRQDVTDILRTLSRSVTPPPTRADIAAADVARGHRALSKRRHRRMAGLAGGVAVVAGVSVAVTLPAQGSGHRTPTAAAGVSAAPKAPASAGDPNTHFAIRLTAYTGAQPAGFTVSTVPAGWKIVSSDNYSFVLAPPGTPPAPSADGQGVSFIGRIVVMLQGDSTLDPHAKVTAVTVNRKAGQLALADGGDAKTSAEWLIYPDAKRQQGPDPDSRVARPEQLPDRGLRRGRLCHQRGQGRGRLTSAHCPGGRTDAGIRAAPRRPGHGWRGHQPEAPPRGRLAA